VWKSTVPCFQLIHDVRFLISLRVHRPLGLQSNSICHLWATSSRISFLTRSWSYSLFSLCLSERYHDRRCAGTRPAITMAVAVDIVLYALMVQMAMTLCGLSSSATLRFTLRALAYIGEAYKSLLVTTVDSSFLFHCPEPPTFGNIRESAKAVACALADAAFTWAPKPSTLCSSIPRYVIFSFIVTSTPCLLSWGSTYPLFVVKITASVLPTESYRTALLIHSDTISNVLLQTVSRMWDVCPVATSATSSEKATRVVNDMPLALPPVSVRSRLSYIRFYNNGPSTDPCGTPQVMAHDFPPYCTALSLR